MTHFFIGLFLCIFSLTAFTQNIPEKTTLCAACHGASGVSINPEWPNLAGQHATYLTKQLQDYKKAKTRSSPVMVSIVASLSDEDIQTLAAFYAQLAPANTQSSKQHQAARGEAIYRQGDANKHITACIACHGPQGTGNELAGFPALSRQQPAYTIQQLKAFKDKNRQNDINSIMRDISARMDTDDMTAVAYYLADLH